MLEKPTPQMNKVLKKSSCTPNQREEARKRNQARVWPSRNPSKSAVKRGWALNALTVLRPVRVADRWENTGLRATNRNEKQ